MAGGCGASPTIGLRVQLPTEIQSAQPLPNPGWQVDVLQDAVTRPLQPADLALAARVKEVVWRGGMLPDRESGAFSIRLQLPARTGPLYFPVVQYCQDSEVRWIGVPRAARRAAEVQFPAPSVTLVPGFTP